jgi:hypothetical protein
MKIMCDFCEEAFQISIIEFNKNTGEWEFVIDFTEHFYIECPNCKKNIIIL